MGAGKLAPAGGRAGGRAGGAGGKAAGPGCESGALGGSGDNMDLQPARELQGSIKGQGKGAKGSTCSVWASRPRSMVREPPLPTMMLRSLGRKRTGD